METPSSILDRNPLDFFDNFKSQIGGKLLDDEPNTDAENKNITKQILSATPSEREKVINDLNKSLDVMTRGLHHIAAWAEGRSVDSSFDEPVAAQSARNALAAATGKSEATLYKEWAAKKTTSAPKATTKTTKKTSGYRR